jgi:hypothetical protein
MSADLTGLYGVICQQIAFFIVSSVRTANPIVSTYIIEFSL